MSRLVLRFAVTGLLTMAVVAVVAAYVSFRIATSQAIDDASRYAALVARVDVQPALRDTLLGGDAASLAALDRAVRGEVLSEPLVRVKVWDRDGSILYSDESRLIGRHYGLGKDEVRALNAGRSHAALSDLSEPENRFEQPATKLVEVYLPVHTPNGTVLLFEAYFRYQGVAEQGRRVWLSFAPFSLGALLLLELLQLPLAVALARRLRRAQQQREGLLRQAIESADAERRRIASDLHDGVVQDLAGVAFSLAAVARRSVPSSEDKAEVHESADRVRDAVRSLRSLLVEIYPPNLYEEGIEGALSDLMARVEPRGIKTSLSVDGAVAELDRDTTQLLYRVAQEGLRNVVAHADATGVVVCLCASDGRLTLEITDDGRGIGGDAASERVGHLGLQTLAGLASAMGASLKVESPPDKGTTLRLTVPAPAP